MPHASTTNVSPKYHFLPIFPSQLESARKSAVALVNQYGGNGMAANTENSLEIFLQLMVSTQL